MDNYNKIWSLIRNTDLLNYDEKNELHLYLIDLKKQQEIIDKAIEYIKENCVQSYCLPSKIYDARRLDLNELLQILEDKEA